MEVGVIILVCSPRAVQSITLYICFFFFNDTATTEIYTYRHTLSLHDALPISDRRHPAGARVGLLRRDPRRGGRPGGTAPPLRARARRPAARGRGDRKSTRLNSSH